MTELLQNDTAGISRVAALLKAGEIVALPTDTVYGLSCDASIPYAIGKIYTSKQRSKGKMLPLLVKDIKQAQNIATLSEDAQKIAQHFWPGGVTLVLPAQLGAKLPGSTQTIDHLCSPDGTIALRVSASPSIAKILSLLTHPIVTTSANLADKPVINDPVKIAVTFGPSLSAVLLPDMPNVISKTIPHLPSTVVRCLHDSPPEILRPGVISLQEIQESLL